jgi:putative heme-binding domain-containing protein
VFPAPKGLGGQELPSIAELLKRSGDNRRGAEVFRRDTVACIRCHKVNEEGIEVGPALTEIGTKLGRDALFESILDPSAGVAFGYEAWQLELKDGDEPFGIIVSETADELSLKAQTGVVSRYRKSEIVRREKQKLSIMPAGLEQGMSVQDLVDLVEYLSSLKKAGP